MRSISTFRLITLEVIFTKNNKNIFLFLDQSEYRGRAAALDVQAARVQEDDHAVGDRIVGDGLRVRLRVVALPRDGSSNPGSYRSLGEDLRSIFRLEFGFIFKIGSIF
jgi:hypothetical protein